MKSAVGGLGEAKSPKKVGKKKADKDKAYGRPLFVWPLPPMSGNPAAIQPYRSKD